MFISVDLPEPEGAHDRDELALVDVERDAAQRVHHLVAHAVGLDQRAGFDQRHGLPWGGRRGQNRRGPGGAGAAGVPCVDAVMTVAPSTSTPASGELGAISSVITPSLMPSRTLYGARLAVFGQQVDAPACVWRGRPFDQQLLVLGLLLGREMIADAARACRPGCGRAPCRAASAAGCAARQSAAVARR